MINLNVPAFPSQITVWKEALPLLAVASIAGVVFPSLCAPLFSYPIGFTATLLVINHTKDYNTLPIEKRAFEIQTKNPYLYPMALIVSVLMITAFPLLSIVFAGSCGIFRGLTYRMAIYKREHDQRKAWIQNYNQNHVLR